MRVLATDLVVDEVETEAAEAATRRESSEGVRQVQSSRPEQVVRVGTIVFPVPMLFLPAVRESLDPSWDLPAAITLE